MTVYFIGAGPGDPELITVKGQNLIAKCNYCLYAGLLVPEAIISGAPKEAKIVNTQSLTLDEIIALIHEAQQNNQDVARVHSGDPSLYGAIAEQMRRLDRLKIDYQVIPGVSAYAAAAAALKMELTIPEKAQSLIVTRTEMKASKMPAGETLENFAISGATLAIHLSIRNMRAISRTLTPHYGADCPVIIAYRVGWPDQQFIHGTLETIHKEILKSKITRTALILVGPALRHYQGEQAQDFIDSALYSGDHHHILRPQ